MPDELMEEGAEAKSGLPLVRALDRGVKLLKAFSYEEPRLSLSELSRRTQLDKGTTRRLLNTLSLAGLVDHDKRTGDYSLSIDVLELASAVETGRDFKTLAAPWLSEISEVSRATSFLWVPHPDGALCIDRVCARMAAVTTNWFNVGARLSYNVGAGPRVLLAFLPEEDRRRILSGALASYTIKSQTDPVELERELTEIRARGWEYATDDYVEGLSAVSVPVFDSKASLVGAVSITSLTQQLDLDGKPRHLDLLRDTAKQIQRSLV